MQQKWKTKLQTVVLRLKKKTKTQERAVLAVPLRECHLLSRVSAIAQPTNLLRLWHSVLTSEDLIVTAVAMTTVNITG